MELCLYILLIKMMVLIDLNNFQCVTIFRWHRPSTMRFSNTFACTFAHTFACILVVVYMFFAETSPAKMHRRDAHFACSLKKEDAFPANSPLSLPPGKLPVVTHICFFQTECKMTPCPCIVAGPVSAKKPICITLWSYLVKKGTAVIHF